MTTPALQSRIHAIQPEADGILTLDLRPLEGTEFPAFSPGAHIDLHLANGMVRSYSLCNDSGERYRYVVGVLDDPKSRGGSRYVHAHLKTGDVLGISAPSNHFPLDEQALHTVLLAGGIGITPILCMARRLKKLGRSMQLIYACRSRRSAAFLAEIRDLAIPLTLHFDDEAGGPPDLCALLARSPPDAGTHHYACGPIVMLNSFEKICDALGHANVHIERFAAVEHAAAADAHASFTVELRRSGISFEVTPAKSLYQNLLDRKINVPFSCSEGICGSCETRVLEGVPDHRDSVLTPRQQKANRVMLPCVSGCRSERLVLDL